jgi:hypothetical protein
MSKKSRTIKNKRGLRRIRHFAKTRKQKVINMIGCSKKHKHNKSCKNMKYLGNNGCPNCQCGSNCKCHHPCPGTCYLNRKKSQKGGFGSGCGSCGCPVGGFTYEQMNKFGGTNNSGEFIKIPGTVQNGGSCGGTCGLQQTGGSFFKPAAPIPGPFVGSSWGASVNEWPGMNGIGGDKNYLNSYAGSITNDPQQQTSMSDSGYKTLNSMIGGYIYNKKKPFSKSVLSKSATRSINKSKSKSRSKSQRGGLIPQDLINLGRDFGFNFKSAYNSLNGYNQPANPSPYKDQLTGTLNNNKILI